MILVFLLFDEEYISELSDQTHSWLKAMPVDN